MKAAELFAALHGNTRVQTFDVEAMFLRTLWQMQAVLYVSMNRGVGP